MKSTLIVIAVMSLLSVLFVSPSTAQTPAPATAMPGATEMAPATAMPNATPMTPATAMPGATEMAPATAMPNATPMAPATVMPGATEMAPATAAQCMSDYTVKAGDRLLRIAATEYNITAYRSLTAAVTAIVDATNAKAASDKTYTAITNPGQIRTGWKLCIPSFTPPPAPAAPAAPAATPMMAQPTPMAPATPAATPMAQPSVTPQ
jgi:pyruvate dehydrogenase E2 component (dihydrolipoamide acetyltransferase)